MELKLIVSDTIDVPVKTTIRDGGRSVTHRFTLQADRMSQSKLRDVHQDDAKTIKDLLQERVHGWSGQRLVCGADGQPAPFSPEAFELLLSLAGMEMVFYRAYLDANGASYTPEGRGKN